MELSELHALSMMIQYPQRAFDIVSNMPDDIFEATTCKTAFRVFKRLMIEQATVDAIVIRNELVKEGVPESDANLWYVDYAQHTTPCFNPTIFYQLYDTYKMRSLRMLAYKAIDDYYKDFNDAKKDIEALLHDMYDESTLVTTIDNIDIEDTGGVPYYTNVDVIDEHLHAFFGGQLITLAGRPSMGKSSLALQIAKQIARQEIPVYFASLEATEREILRRLIASETGIPVYSMLTDNLDNLQRLLVKGTYECLKSQLATFHIIQRYTLDDILYVVRKDKPERALLVIDYLQIIHAGKKRSRVEEIAEITRTLKLFAMEYNIPILLLSQLNRDADGSVPKLSDLRDSGTIEQDSDVVIFIHKDDKRSTKAQIIFAKARDAGVQFVDVYHDLSMYSFSLRDNTILI